MGDVGGDAPGHTEGKSHLMAAGQQASSMYASGGIYQDGLYIVYAHMCMCVRVFVYTAYALTLLHICIPRDGREEREKTGGPAVRRRAEKRGSHNKAPRGSHCMQHSSGETRTFGASVTVLGANYMDAWPALPKFLPRHGTTHTALGHVLRIPYRVLLRANTRLCPPSRGALERHIAIAFHPSSDSSSRLATSVLTGEPGSRMPPAVAAVVVRRRRLPPPPPTPPPPPRGPGACRRRPGLRSAHVPRPAILIQLCT